ncbi:MAG: hypothetical protein IID59_11055 [Proteobacteria bacterium]|nr:hypothetical protein [Pseudomonadota bacterium]
MKLNGVAKSTLSFVIGATGICNLESMACFDIPLRFAELAIKRKKL